MSFLLFLSREGVDPFVGEFCNAATMRRINRGFHSSYFKSSIKSIKPFVSYPFKRSGRRLCF